MQIVNKLIKDLQEIKDEKQIKEFLFQLIKLLEVDYFLFGMTFPLSILNVKAQIIENYPIGWLKNYEEQDLINLDPVAHYCKKYNSPNFWDELSESDMGKLQSIGKGFFPGVRTGVSIPLHGALSAFGVFSLSLCSTDENSREILQKALAIALPITPHLQDAITRIRQEKCAEKIKLTNREIECLTWATEGKSAWEISKILNCTERTVTFHLANATIKLNCTNRYQALCKAIITGVITAKLF